MSGEEEEVILRLVNSTPADVRGEMWLLLRSAADRHDESKSPFEKYMKMKHHLNVRQMIARERRGRVRSVTRGVARWKYAGPMRFSDMPDDRSMPLVISQNYYTTDDPAAGLAYAEEVEALLAAARAVVGGVEHVQLRAMGYNPTAAGVLAGRCRDMGAQRDRKILGRLGVRPKQCERRRQLQGCA